MYCGASGKRGNRQIGIGVHAVTDWASAAVDWRSFLPSGGAASVRTAALSRRELLLGAGLDVVGGGKRNL